MKSLVYAAIVALAPTVLQAQSQIERFEAIAEQMNGAMAELMATEIESLGGDATAIREATTNMPSWDQPMRKAAQCALDRYTDETSAAAVDGMLDSMEDMMAQMASMSLSEFADSAISDSALPEGLTDEQAFAISTDCGLMELQMQAAQSSGLMEAMMAAGATVPQ